MPDRHSPESTSALQTVDFQHGVLEVKVKIIPLSYWWNSINLFPLLRADDIGINLRDTDIGMSQQFTDGIQLGTVSQAEGSKGMASHMESYFLSEPGSGNPLFQ